MQYFNQLVLNGEIDNVGNPKRLNVSNSYRRGIELELSYQPIKQIGVLGNISLSQNKITNFKEVISRYDASFNGLAPQINNYNLTDISFSPSMVSSAQLIITPIKKQKSEFEFKFELNTGEYGSSSIFRIHDPLIDLW